MKYFIGPKVSFDVPGFLDVALLFRNERNHDWFATSSGFGGAGCSGTCNPDVAFDNTFQIEAAWGIPFEFMIPLKFQGFFNLAGAKGTGGTHISSYFEKGSIDGKRATESSAHLRTGHWDYFHFILIAPGIDQCHLPCVHDLYRRRFQHFSRACIDNLLETLYGNRGHDRLGFRSRRLGSVRRFGTLYYESGRGLDCQGGSVFFI